MLTWISREGELRLESHANGSTYGTEIERIGLAPVRQLCRWNRRRGSKTAALPRIERNLLQGVCSFEPEKVAKQVATPNGLESPTLSLGRKEVGGE